MIVFPCLASGAIAQRGARRTTRFRTVQNGVRGGDSISDSFCRYTEWVLPMEDLAPVELARLLEFFELVRGTQGTFRFLDPFDNLFRWSGNLLNGAWQRDPFLEVRADASGPIPGRTGYRILNTSDTYQAIAQFIGMPGSYTACFSLWLRTWESGSVVLRRRSETMVGTMVCGVTRDWSRVFYVSELEGSADVSEFSVIIAPGKSVEVFGLQVEVQRAPSEYMETDERSGVYDVARLTQDSLDVEFVGNKRSRCVVGIEARW